MLPSHDSTPRAMVGGAERMNESVAGLGHGSLRVRRWRIRERELVVVGNCSRALKVSTRCRGVVVFNLFHSRLGRNGLGGCSQLAWARGVKVPLKKFP
jgi:hypothetical protein